MRNDPFSRIGPDEPVFTEGVSTSPMVARLQSLPVQMHDVAMLVMVQPETIAYVDQATGEMLAADMVEYAVRNAGGSQVVLPLNPEGPTPGWRARLQLGPAVPGQAFNPSELVIEFPNGMVFFDGVLNVTGPWLDKVKRAGHVTVITGPIATTADAETIITTGRALHVHVPIEIKA